MERVVFFALICGDGDTNKFSTKVHSIPNFSYFFVAFFTSSFASWFFCAIASLILTLITRRIIQRANINLAFVGIIYTALFALYAMLLWLAFF